jgi:SAM-dependent methyltransferase
MSDKPYFPEGDKETTRLDVKTDKQSVIDQARWAGLKPGMRILDVGCGPGITSSALALATQPGSKVVGIDQSEERIEYAQKKYGNENVEFICRDFFEDLSDLGEFDFIWVRFVLEFYLEGGYQLVKHLTNSVKKGGILCLADLDNNCMNHYGLDKKLENAFIKSMECQMKNNNFDPYAGRKLHQFLFDAGMTELRSDLRAHHLIYGELSDADRWHWWQKVELAGKRSGYAFDEFEGGYEEFVLEFKKFFSKPNRFTYTPLILSRGVKHDFQEEPASEF